MSLCTSECLCSPILLTKMTEREGILANASGSIETSKHFAWFIGGTKLTKHVVVPRERANCPNNALAGNTWAGRDVFPTAVGGAGKVGTKTPQSGTDFA